MEGIKIKTPLGLEVGDLFNTTKDTASWKDSFEFNTPVKSGIMSEDSQKEILTILQDIFTNAKVEVWEERSSVKFKVRFEFNAFPTTLVKVEEVLRAIRESLNQKSYKKCKVFYLDYLCDPDMNSFNVVYNPKWRKYENYEILFRSKTQLRRSRER